MINQIKNLYLQLLIFHKPIIKTPLMANTTQGNGNLSCIGYDAVQRVLPSIQKRIFCKAGISCLFILFLLLFKVGDISAQKWQAGFSLGTANYHGDLRDDPGGFDGARLALAASLHRIYSSRFQMDAQLMFGNLGAHDKNGANKTRNLSFDTRVIELSVTGRVNIIAKKDARLVPYLSAGLAGFYANPHAFDASGKRQELYPLSTEGQGLSQYPNRKVASKFNIAIPFGPGLDFRVGKHAHLDIEAMFRKTFTDHLDDVSGNYPDRTVLQNAKGPKAVEMSYRGPGNFPAAGTARGNSDLKDWYHTLVVRLRVPLGKQKVKVAPVPTTPVVPVAIDRDNDGVTDAQDKCPDVAGPVRNNGCPILDTDKDGINDEKDKCPTVAGLARYDGCPVPDTDKDGLNDEQDKCPTVAGLAKYDGCPIPDADGDGVNDEEDRCPTLAGNAANNGCPSIDFNASNIQFATGTSNLTPAAKTELNKLAVILNRDYPNIKLAIEGHTDNVGKAEINQTLSEKRAAAVKTYLIGKKVDATRLSSVGYGPAQPVADNATAEGKAKNRRVEFKVSE